MDVTPSTAGVFTYVLTCTTASGSVSGSATLTAASLTINAASILLGQSATLTWSAAGQTTCVASGAWSGTQALTGTLDVSPGSTGRYLYNLSCTGPTGTASLSTMLQVTPFAGVTVSPASALAGQPAMLSWSSAGATNCTASDAWTGTQATSGQATTSPVFPGVYHYTLSCADSMGNVTVVTTISTVAPNGFSNTRLVADGSVPARYSDSSLLNPWGIAFPTNHAAVVANNQGNTSTSYDGSGVTQSPGTGTSTFAVQLPAGVGGVPFNPTGVVAAPAGMTVTAAGKSGPAQLIYAGESGMIAAWSPTVDPTNAVIVYADGGGAVYKSLAVAGNAVYAADFHNNRIDVFDSTFAKQVGYPFIDPTLPAGYASHGLYVDGSSIYIAYAKQLAPANRDAAAGAGLGIVDVFDLNGNFSRRLIAGGALNAPWGMAVASERFCYSASAPCSLAQALLVANTGDGRINGFDPETGAFIYAVSDASGAPLTIAGLHGIAFGNRYANQPEFTLFYTGGVNNSGLFGRIDFGAAPRLHAPPGLSTMVTGPNIEHNYFATANATSAIGIAWLDWFGPSGSHMGIRNCCAPFLIDRFGGGPGDRISATVTDVDGNIATSSVTLP